MKRDVLDNYHPITAFVFFCVMIVTDVIFFHPIVNSLSLLAALLYGLWLRGTKALKFFAIMPVLIGAVTILVNLLFVHKGITVLFYMGDNPVTKEALGYGICAGIMTGAVLMWFYCAGIVMTSDKFIYIFGRTLPTASLMFSMTMRFVPRFVGQAKKIRQARKAMGCNDGKATSGAINTLSVMSSWALENSIETADSMKSREYGKPGRSTYSIFKLEGRDVAMWGIIVLATVVTAIGKIHFECYPIINQSGSAWSITTFGLLCFIPMIINLAEEIKWKYFQLRI